MLNTILKSDKKQQNNLSVDSLLNDVYLLPRWEKIKNIFLHQKRFLISTVSIQTFLYRKFSTKNNIEKYLLKDKKDRVLGSIDLRVYKDSVYIINISVAQSNIFEDAANILIQVAAEKALYNTTERQLKINLLLPIFFKNKLKKLICCEDFYTEASQSSYEKEMFGETFTLDIETSCFWQKKIRQMPILINK